MVDTYTKAVLTVIALALVALVAKPFVRPECGRGYKNPCVVISDNRHPVYVTTTIGEPLYVTTPLGMPMQVTIDR